MAALNKVMLIGKVGGDPNVKSVGEHQVATFSLATSEKYKDRNGELMENTVWHTIEVWDSPAVMNYVKKGGEVYVEGSLKTDKWQGQDGEQKERTKIRAGKGGILLLRSSGNVQPVAPQAPQPTPQVPDDMPFYG